MKTLAYFPRYTALNSKPVMSAFLESAKRKYTVKENNMDCDAAVIWSCLWKGAMAPNQEVYKHYRSQNKPVYIIEVGALKRNITWKVAINHITAEGIYGHKQNVDPDRPKKLQLPELQPMQGHHGSKKILICMQHTDSEQMAKLNYDQIVWLNDTIAKIREHEAERDIVIRPHPRSSFQGQSGQGIITEKPRFVAGTYDDFDLDFHDTKKLDSYFPEGKAEQGEGPWWCMINYNSAGPAFSALIAGVPIIVDQTSLAHEHAVGFDKLYNPFVGVRDEWYQQVSHTEYTVDEIAEGRWLERLSWAIKH